MKNKYKQKNIDMCIRLIARHDYTGLEEFYKEFSNPIYRFSLMLLHDSHLAEDAMQNTFVKIMANAKSYSPGTNPRAWIFAIARNVCMDLYNKKVPIVEDTVLHSFSDEYAIDTLNDSITVREAIQKLTEIEKEILSLYIFAGLKQIEIAKVLQFPYVKVRSHYKYAIQKLRKELSD